MIKKLRPGVRRDVDMTEGDIFKNIIRFALPLLVGNLFQQLYNMVDTWVIGQTGENGAYAAVGSVGPIINILIGFFSGLATGAGVVISRYYGAKDSENVKKAVHTVIAMTLVLAVLFTVLGITMTPLFLRLMLHTDGTAADAESVYPYARTYLTIYFAGVAGLMLYNVGAGILRAVGDSDRPFLFLVVSAVTNTLLDLLFVFVFRMGVAGVAWATIIAQILSAVLTVITLLRTDSVVKLEPKEIRFHWGILGRIVKIGLPAAIQMALTSFSNVFVQSYIANVNGDQTISLAAWTTYSKVDQLIFLPMQTLALAVTTFVGQNLGKGDVARAKKGTLLSWLTAVVTTVVLMIPILLFAPSVAWVFNRDPDVVALAGMLLRCLTPFYVFCCVNQVFSGALRGAGDSIAPMLIMLISFVGFRQVYLYVMSNYISNDLLPIGLGYPAGWIVCASTLLLYYRFFFSFEKRKGAVKNG
ncbi:MAG: MATE family efflux transporter [Lachnospiraceae bacterium]|nr:MATE family efflux transporter [Lachnospiraceae bacterium]